MSSFPGCCTPRILRSQYPHARIVSVDASEVPADVVVLMPDDVRDQRTVARSPTSACLRSTLRGMSAIPLRPSPRRPPPRRRRSRRLIQVDYEELPAVFDVTEAARETAPLVHDAHEVSANPRRVLRYPPTAHGTNVCHLFSIRSGDIDLGFAERMSSWRARSGRGCQSRRDGATRCDRRWDGDRLEVWSGTQTPFNVRSDAASIFGVAVEQVVVPPMGGSFGAKTFVRLEAIVAALAHRRVVR